MTLSICVLGRTTMTEPDKSKDKKKENDTDWSLTTWEGSQREAMRRWSQLPLERLITALEEMQDIQNALSQNYKAARPDSIQTAHKHVMEQDTGYDTGHDNSHAKVEAGKPDQ